MSASGPTYAICFKEFMRRPWTLGRAYFLAVSVGLALPLINPLFFWALPWRSARVAIFPLMAVVTALLYCQVDRAQFRTDRRAMLATAVAGLVWAAGAVGSAWCAFHHLCMGGHMEHPPFALWDYVIDAGWALCLVIAAIWMRMVRASLFLTFTTLTAFLLSYRFLFGSFGGMYEHFPL